MLDGLVPLAYTASRRGTSAETEDQLDDVPLVLKSTDGETIRTRYGIIKQSTTLADLVEAQGGNPDLSQPLAVQLDAKMLRAVIKWCDFHRGKGSDQSSCRKPTVA